MKFKHLCLLLLGFASFFASCDQPEVIEPAEIIFNNGGSDSFHVGAAANEITMRFSTNYAWQVSLTADEGWLEVNPKSGKAGDSIVQVKVSENDGSERSAILTVSCDDIQKSVEIIQAAAALRLDLSDDSFEVPSSGAELTVSVQSNSAWTISGAAQWLELSASKGSGDAEIEIIVHENENTVSRRAVLTVKAGELEREILIEQMPAEQKYTYIEFADASVESYCLANYDVDGDGRISLEHEAGEVREIRLNDASGSINLSDLKHFPNLEELSIEGGSISDIDLSGNSRLKVLELLDNYNGTGIDLSYTPALTKIFIRHSQLESIDVSKLRRLEDLRVLYASLSELDLSGNPGLKILYCHCNDLRVLDVSYNTRLTKLYVSPMNNDKELEYVVVRDSDQSEFVRSQSLSSTTSVLVKGRLYLSSDLIEVDSSGGVIEAVVKCTESCQVSEIPSWISLKDVAVNDVFTSTYSFTVAENSASVGRQGEIRFSDENRQFKGVLKVTQSALQETYMEFADTAIEAYCLANYDADGDGRISVGRETDEIDVIWMSDVTGTVSLADIKYFRNLNTLGIEGGRINDIDLSHNEKLQQLELLDNYKGTAIDFSHTPDLQNIFIRHSSLTSLDVTMLKKLEDLRVIYADLTELDLSENPELRILFCHNNHLKVLDVSENPKLSNLYVSPMRDGKMLEYLIIAEGMSFNVSEDIKVVVKGGFDISIQETEVGHTGGVIETEITSTESCQVSEIPSWISLKDVVAKDDLTSIYSFTVAENSALTERQGEIEFSNASGQIVGVLKVIQSALQETYVEFVDATVEAYCLANYDTDGDGRITCGRETDEVTGINMSGVSGNISLSDIRHFGNLETLGVTGGSINGIDLSHNEKLIYLYLYDNYQGTGIDFSHTPDMQSIFISSSSLKSVDVSMLKKLKTLTITYADLSELDVTGNPELKVLHCHNNRITVLDVSGNPKLSELSVSPMKNDKELEYLIVAGNMSFNVPENTKVIERGAFRPLADTIELPCEGGWFEVAVQTTEPCSVVEDSDWLRSSGWDDLIASGYKVIYYFVAEENEQETERTTVLTVKDASGNDVASVVVRQAAYVPDEVGGGNEDIIKGEDIIM